MDEPRYPAGILGLLGAIELPARLTPRTRLELGLLPVGEEGVDSLHKAAIANLRLTDSDEAITLGIRCLLALGELCRELECSERLGLIGGHQSILRLMTEGHISGDARRHVSASPGATINKQEEGGEEREEEDEVQSAAALAASHVVSSGSAFPMRTSYPGEEGSSGLGRFPLRYDFAINHDVATTVTTTTTSSAASDDDDDDDDAAGATSCRGSRSVAAKDNGAPLDSTRKRQLSTVLGTAVGGGHVGASERGGDGESISILVRPVKERQHSQFDVGFVMWPAAVILSRLLCRHPHLVRGRRVLEIGAGLGLAGLVAARIQQSPSSGSNYSSGELALPGGTGTATAASVTLSDFNPLVLTALEANVALNSPDGGAAAGGNAIDDLGRKAENCGEYAGSPAIDAARESLQETVIAPGMVYVRHLDWDKLESLPRVEAEGYRFDSMTGHGVLTQVGAADSDGFGNGERSSSKLNSCLSLESLASGHPSGSTAAVRGVKRGERFDVIIASDHICQASDAEGTIRVLQAMLADAPESTATPSATLARGGQAHFIVAHPRTRWGVDALVPLLQQTPGLAFACEEVTDPRLVSGLEEAAYLAWLHVHVWRVNEPVAEPAAAEPLLVAG